MVADLMVSKLSESESGPMTVSPIFVDEKSDPGRTEANAEPSYC